MKCAACGYSTTVDIYGPTATGPEIDGKTPVILKWFQVEDKDAESFVHVGTIQRNGPVPAKGPISIIITNLFACPKCGTVRAEDLK